MLPAVPAWVPGKVHNGGIKPELKLPAHVATQSFVRIELTIPERQVESPMCLLWHKYQQSPGKECLAAAGTMSGYEYRPNSAVWKNSWKFGSCQETFIVGS